MSIWFKVSPDRGDFTINPVNVSRETEHFIYVDEQQVWNGKTVTRQRRVAKQGHPYSARYFPSQVAAMQALYDDATAKVERLEADLHAAKELKLKLFCRLDEAKQGALQ